MSKSTKNVGNGTNGAKKGDEQAVVFLVKKHFINSKVPEIALEIPSLLAEFADIKRNPEGYYVGISKTKTEYRELQKKLIEEGIQKMHLGRKMDYDISQVFFVDRLLVVPVIEALREYICGDINLLTGEDLEKRIEFLKSTYSGLKL